MCTLGGRSVASGSWQEGQYGSREEDRLQEQSEMKSYVYVK